MPQKARRITAIFILPRRRILGDDRAQISFAVVAVLLLVLSGGCALIISQAQLKVVKMDDSRQKIPRMYESAMQFSQELEEEAFRTALRTCETVKALNDTMLEVRFQEDWGSRSSLLTPTERAGLVLSLDNSSVHLDFLRLSQENSSGNFTSSGGLEWNVAGIPAFFTVSGSFLIIVREGESELSVRREVQRHIYLPLPLLLGRLDAFERSTEGGKNRLMSMVQYELASLIQLRVLEGCGVQSISGFDFARHLLEEDDVKRALGLGIILVELECFGSFDKESAVAILNDFPFRMTADELITLIHGKCRVDPADLYLLLNGIDELDLRKVLAQALYSNADVLVLKWLDYLQIIHLVDCVERVSIKSLTKLNEFLDDALGQDRLLEFTVQWMQKRLDKAGYAEDAYRWLHTDKADETIWVPAHDLDVLFPDGQIKTIAFEGHQCLDFDSLDVLSSERWKDFTVSYRSRTYELATLLQRHIRSVAEEMAEGSGLAPLRLKLDPFDEFSFMDEITDGMRDCLAYQTTFIDEGIISSGSKLTLQDPLGEALIRFLDNEWQSIFRMNSSVDNSLEKLSYQMVADALDRADGFGEASKISYSRILAYQMKNDATWGMRQQAEKAFMADVEERIRIFSNAFLNLTVDGLPRLFNQVVIQLAQGLIREVPGIKATAIESCIRMLDDISRAAHLRSDRILAEPAPPHIVLSLGGRLRSIEQLVPELAIPWLEDANRLDVSIQSPLDYDASARGPNLHLTDPNNISFAPYQSNFEIGVSSSLSINLKCLGELSDLSTFSGLCGITREIYIGFDQTMTCSSAWPIEGVVYSPSTTILKELEGLFDKLWEGVLSAFDILAAAAEKLYVRLQAIFSDLLSFSTRLVQSLSDMLMNLVQEVRELIDGAIGDMIEWLEKTIVEKMGATSFTMEFGGLRFIFDFAPTDLFLGRSKEYLRVGMVTNLLNSQLVVQARFVDIYRQGPDLIANISLAGDDWRAECVIDPRMMVMDHFVELRGLFSDFVLELAMPVLVSYEKRSFRLSDIPGLGLALSNIPMPIPGLKASIDAGFEMKYNRPFCDHLVINEVELNPEGRDQGREWVELYNPSNTEMDLSEWTLRTSHGEQSVSSIGEAVIGPKSHILLEFPGQWLDNGGETGYPLGESLSLIDATGRKVDSMPYLTDYYNDERTWQRSFDASDRWEFREKTRDSANGFMMVNYNDMDRWQQALMDAIAQALSRMGGAFSSIDSLAEVIRSAIEEVVETLIETIARSIVEMSLFIEVALQDYSQSFDGRLRLALVMTGEGVRDALLWIADVIGCALNNLLNPTAISPRAHTIEEIMDDVYIRFGAYGTMGLPRLLSSVAGNQRFQFGASIELNLPVLIAPSRGPRNWTINFGALFQEVPGAYLRSFFPVDADNYVDCWIMRASVHSVRIEGPCPIDDWSG